MSALTTYKGLQVITPDPTGAAGLAINENFKAVADRLETLYILDANTNQPPSSGFATVDVSGGRLVLDYDDAAAEAASWDVPLPPGVSSLSIQLRWRAAATTGAVRWGVSADRKLGAEADSYGAEAAATASPAGSSLQDIVTTIALSALDSAVAGDRLRLRVRRIAADVADTLVGDAELVSVRVMRGG